MPLPGVKNPFRSRLARGTRAARTRAPQASAPACPTQTPGQRLGSRGCWRREGGGSRRGLRGGRSPPGQGLSGSTLARPLTVAVPSLCPTANEGSGGGPSGSVRPRREWPAAESTSTHRSAQGEPGAAEAAAPLPPGWGAARTRRVTPGSVPLRRGFLPPWR